MQQRLLVTFSGQKNNSRIKVKLQINNTQLLYVIMSWLNYFEDFEKTCSHKFHSRHSASEICQYSLIGKFIIVYYSHLAEHLHEGHFFMHISV